ncbi:MAG: TatD family hydrolase [Gemmatimonadota bacterium]
MRLFDSHLHLTDGAFTDDRDEVVARARAVGVEEMVTVATTPEDAATALALARATDGAWSTAGLHPHEADALDETAVGTVRRLAAEPEVVAIGETGLDFHYDHAPRGRQAAAFETQLGLAAELGLPVVVHSREADAETEAAIVRFAGRVRGVLHCFTGGRGLLDRALEADWFVSFGGIVTFRNFDAADNVARVPDDRLLIETDSPYLAPVPRRGRRNEPANLPHTCARIAAMRGVTPEALAERTRRNARSFYAIDSPT